MRTLTPAAGPQPDEIEPPPRPAFRGDVDGLRALAILAVVGFHASVPGFSGGFVGVDVFFAISGWLISRNLLATSTETGRVGLVAFWSRRIRRLVPAMALMIVAVFAGSIVVLSPLEWSTIVGQGRAAALYVSNIVFARAETGYFDQSIQDSPFLHTWSLAVEEQFYLVWPVLFAVVAAVTRRSRQLLPKVLIGVFAITFVVSLALSIVLTAEASPWAFYSLPTRAWEFAAAGLLAALPLRRTLGTAARSLVGLAGVVLILGATVLLGDIDAYPGAWALIPVGGTLLVVIAGDQVPLDQAGTISRTLAARPLQWVGRVSYSWYLWHWPAIVFAVAYFGRDDVGLKVAAAGASLALAAVLYRFYESPIRFAPKLRRSRTLTLAMGAAFTLVAVVGSVGLARLTTREMQESPYRELAAVRRAHVRSSCANTQVSPSGVEFCEYGDPTAARTVLLVGDSHARQWQGAFGAAAERSGIRLVVRQLSSCPATPVPIAVGRGDSRQECPTFRIETGRLIDELEPDAVVISDHLGYGGQSSGNRIEGDDPETVWGGALASYLDELGQRGVAVGFVRDNAQLPANAVDCLARQSTCSYDRSDVRGLSGDLWQTETDELSRRPEVLVFDGNQDVCDAETCFTVVDGVYVFADGDHLTEPFTLTQVTRIEAFLAQLE